MKILVVDDEVEVGDFLCGFLQRLGLESHKAVSGEEALEMFNLVKPDWVFLDLKMPDIDGLEVLRRMKKIHQPIQALMITGMNDELSENEAYALGVKDYLIKPIDLDELRTKINKYILKGK